MSPAPLVDRVALWVLVPSVFLPGIALLVFPDPSHPAWTPNSIAIVVWLFVLLGSMTLNAWLRLRQPIVLLRRALTRRGSSYTFAVTGFAAVVVVLVVMYPVLHEWVIAVIGVAGAVLSIASWADSLIDEPAVLSAPYGGELSGRARLLLSVGSAALVGAAVSLVFVATAAPVVFNDASVVLLLLGLPWSHPVYFVLTLPSLGLIPAIVMPIALAVCVALNSALILLLAHLPRFRLNATHWFFRLDRLTAPERGIEAMSEP